MDFNSLVLNKLGPLFHKYDLRLIDHFKNYLKFKSEHVIVTLSHDERDNTNSINLGENEDYLIPLDDKIIESVFKSPVKINFNSIDSFIDNLFIFLSNEGSSLLFGNAVDLKKIEKYHLTKAKNYTKEILNDQIFKAADEAWERKDYEKFIELIDNIPLLDRPSSYQLKYAIALRKQ